MRPWKILITLAAVALIGGTGYVVGSQGQQHGLGLEKALPESGTAVIPQGDLPGMAVPGGAVFRIVGQEGDYVLVQLMIKQGDTWRPAKIQSPASGFE